MQSIPHRRRRLQRPFLAHHKEPHSAPIILTFSALGFKTRKMRTNRALKSFKILLSVA